MIISLRVSSLLFLSLTLFAVESASGVDKNGFDLSGSLVPASKILHGGPPRDGIPALFYPSFIGSLDADYLANDDRVLGVEVDGLAKAYPVKILNYHEVINDRVGAHRFAVSYCPLCGSGIAFEAPNGERFGVSGLLYESDVLLYDQQTDSLWSQLKAQAVSGPRKGTKLKTLPLKHTTWQGWRREHPDTLVLSRDTGYPVNYERSPYAGYDRRARLLFPVSHHSRNYPAKEQVLGVEVDGHFRAYPFAELAKRKSPVMDTFQGHELTLTFDLEHRTGWVESNHPDQFSSVLAYWFAWFTFHPETEVWQAESEIE